MEEFLKASLNHFSFSEIMCLFLLFKMDKSINQLNDTINQLVIQIKEQMNT